MWPTRDALTDSEDVGRRWTWATHRWWHDLMWRSGQTYRWFFASPEARDWHRSIFAPFATVTASGE